MTVLLLFTIAKVKANFVDTATIKHDKVVIESRLRDRAVGVRWVAELNAKAELLQGRILEETAVPPLCDPSASQRHCIEASYDIPR